MDIKRIIREESDDLEWMKDIPASKQPQEGMLIRIDKNSPGFIDIIREGEDSFTILKITRVDAEENIIEYAIVDKNHNSGAGIGGNGDVRYTWAVNELIGTGYWQIIGLVNEQEDDLQWMKDIEPIIKSCKDLSVGDRVAITSNYDNVDANGDTGTVVDIYPNEYLIAFDEKIHHSLHDGNGQKICGRGTCWFFECDRLDTVDKVTFIYGIA